MIIEVPRGFWCQLPLKVAKLAKTLRPTDVVKVYTPTATGQWTNALGSIKGHASTLFQFYHSASTDFGASGGLVLTTGGTCLGVHLRRDPIKGLNVAVALKHILRPPVEESSEGDYDMFDEREHDPDRAYPDDRSDGGIDDDWNALDDDDDYQRSVYIGGKAGHRSFTAITKSAYTQEQRDADFALEDTLIERGVMNVGSWASYTNDDLSFLKGKAFESGGSVEGKGADATSVPSALISATSSLLVSPPQIGATSPLSTVSPGIRVSTEKVETPSLQSPTPASSPTLLESTPGVALEKKTPTLSSAPPSADSLLAEGKKKNPRQRKRKNKSLVSVNGTSPTSPLKPPTSVLATKPATESKEPNQTKTRSKKSRKGSSGNTQKPKNLAVSEAMSIVNAVSKSYADALRGSLTKKSQKTPNPESRTPD
jgi:hypothetical protein